MAKKSGYTGTQRDDYTGTPAKRASQKKPKPRKRPSTVSLNAPSKRSRLSALLANASKAKNNATRNRGR